MAVCDLPFANPHAMVSVIRHSIYKYMLFLTRFTGRGMWYCFLGTMIWAALWDLNISWFLGFVLGMYVILLGIASMLYGFNLSFKLDGVRKCIYDQDVERPKPPHGDMKGFAKQEFADVCLSVNQTKFTEDELDYVINALSFSPENDGGVSMIEYNYWLEKGWMSIV